MYLYITSDVNTTAEVRIGGASITGSPFVITENTVQAVPIDPEVLKVYIGSSDFIETGKAIQVIACQSFGQGVVYGKLYSEQVGRAKCRPLAFAVHHPGCRRQHHN